MLLEAEESLAFYEAMDEEIGKLVKAGAIVGATADHGMNAKVKANGQPNVLFVEDMLDEKFGEGFRVICPITDPYVKHHGALGSYVVVHVDKSSRHHRSKKLVSHTARHNPKFMIKQQLPGCWSNQRIALATWWYCLQEM